MKKSVIIALAVMALPLMAQKQNQTYLDYIEQWKETAVQQQTDYGVPAAITMAQALLESAAGQSELALNARNHFGIKCTSDWFGGVYYYDDDSRGECFRQYADAYESFKDHSLFLKRPRYATCFEIAVEDYEGWAHRLKACGYATDPGYASKLIKIIEDYRLDTLAATPELFGKKEPEPQKPLKAEVVHQTEPIKVFTQEPEPPYVAPISAREEKKTFLLTHPVKRCNGIKYVDAREGDTYANIAFRLNVRERQLREWNDALGRDLAVGDRVFMSAKKKKVPAEKTVLWVHPGESLWEICQREGIQIAQVQKLNGFPVDLRTFRTRQQIYLNKVKEEK